MTIYKKLYLLLSEIENALVPNKESKRRRGVLYATLWALDAITEVSMALQDWAANPKGLLIQLIGELEDWEKLRWENRIQEILQEI
jgi:hypothetical protein